MARVSNSINLSSGGSGITVVANYSALPDPTTVSGKFYWVSNSQGTKWLPGTLGGTYYTNGMYYSNGTTWEFIDVPYQATQAEVNAGTNTDKFVTPKTFNDSTQLSNLVTAISGKEDTSNKSLDVNTDFASNVKYPSVKAVYDFCVNGFILIESLGNTIHAYASKSTPIDADEMVLADSANFAVTKKVTWVNIKATLKTYFDTIYTTASDVATQIATAISGKADKSQSAYTIRANNTNATADTTELVYKAVGKQTYAGTLTWTGTTAPSGASSLSYNFLQIGNLVILTIEGVFATSGTAITALTATLPSDCPTPIKPDGLTSASENLYPGYGKFENSTTANVAAGNAVYLRSNAANNGFEITITQASSNPRVFRVTIQYFTS